MLHLTNPNQLMEPTSEEHERALASLKLDQVRDELFRLDAMVDAYVRAGRVSSTRFLEVIEAYRSFDAAWVFLSRELGTLN